MRERNAAGQVRWWSVASVGRAVALGLTYAALSWLVQFVTAFGDESSSSVFWPAAGVTVAILVRRPRVEWPLLLAAVWIAETALDLGNGYAVPVSIAWGLANAAEPLVAVLLLDRFGDRDPDLGSRRGLLRFVAFAVLVGPLVGATIGATASVLFVDDVWWPRLPRWFLGDAIAVLTIAPVLLAFRGGAAMTITPPRRALLPGLALVVTVVVALGPWSAPASYGLPYLVVPAIVVVALQLSPRESALAMLLVAVVVEVTTALSAGPFAERDPGTGLVEAQMFLAMSAFSCWGITALMADLVDRERAAAELLAVTLRDDLTGLGNRRLLVQRLQQAAARMTRTGTSIGVLFIDLDGFKAVNDRYGHLAGDDVLQAVGARIHHALRDLDTVARLGGDEFVVLSEDCATRHDAELLAARIEAVIGEPFDWHGNALRIGASIGVVHASAIDDVEAFLDEADRAMYQVKLARTEAEAESRRSGAVG